MPWNKINLLIKFKNLSKANIDIWGLSVKTLYMYVTEFAFWLECLTGESGNHSQITTVFGFLCSQSQGLQCLSVPVWFWCKVNANLKLYVMELWNLSLKWKIDRLHQFVDRKTFKSFLYRLSASFAFFCFLKKKFFQNGSKKFFF